MGAFSVSRVILQKKRSQYTTPAAYMNNVLLYHFLKTINQMLLMQSNNWYFTTKALLAIAHAANKSEFTIADSSVFPAPNIIAIHRRAKLLYSIIVLQ